MLGDAFTKQFLSITRDCRFLSNIPIFALDPFQGDASCIFGQVAPN